MSPDFAVDRAIVKMSVMEELLKAENEEIRKFWALANKSADQETTRDYFDDVFSEMGAE